MFVLADLQHTVQIEPDEMDAKFEDIIIDKLNAMLANKVIKDVGLCMTFYDFIEIESSYIPQGSATTFVPVKFRYLVFVLFPGEVHDCKIGQHSKEGIGLTSDFFEDIFVPKENLPEKSEFDAEAMMWSWKFEEEGQTRVYPIEPGSLARVIVESTTYYDIKAGKSGKPMVVKATMNAAGLGCWNWWHDEEAPPA